MNFFWIPDAERDLRNLGLTPVFDQVKQRFESYDFYAPAPHFGSHHSTGQRGRLVYHVVFTIEWPTLMDLSRDDDLVCELLVKCIPSAPEQRDALYEKHGTIVKGIVVSVGSALAPFRPLTSSQSGLL